MCYTIGALLFIIGLLIGNFFGWISHADEDESYRKGRELELDRYKAKFGPPNKAFRVDEGSK